MPVTVFVTLKLKNVAFVLTVKALKVTSPLALSAAKFVAAVAADLQAHRGSSVVIPGEHQPPVVHALAHAINAQLGNVGKTVVYTDPVIANPVNQLESFKDLLADMSGGKVQLLIVAGVNPLFDSPSDLDFAKAFESVPLRIHHGLYQDETA